MSEIETLFEILEEISYMLESSDIVLSDISSVLTSITSILTMLSTGLTAIIGITSASLTFLLGAVVVIFSVVWFLVFYLLRAIPLFVLARKANSKFAWLVWLSFIPVIDIYCRMFVLCDIAGKKPFVIIKDKFKIDNRVISFLIYVVVCVFGNTLVTAAIGVLNMVPGIGQLITPIASLLYLLPTAVCCIIDYVYLRDAIDVFKEDKKSNNTAAIVITILDTVLLFDFIRTIYLYTLLKRKPLANDDNIIGQPIEVEYSSVSNDRPIA